MTSDSWHAPQKILAVGHRATLGMLAGPVIVEEKVDGSFIQFGVSAAGELRIRSKGATIEPEAPDKMFTKAVETVKRLEPDLVPGWTYRGEYLRTPKHNTLAYDRVPVGNIILFDVLVGEEDYLQRDHKRIVALRLGLECVPLLGYYWSGDTAGLEGWLETDSILGGQKVEGVVIKPTRYDILGTDGKVVMAKYVSPRFKEVHGGEWKKRNPGKGDILDRLGERYRSEARWNKAVAHLRDAGLLMGEPKDIGPLMADVPNDVEAECRQEILDELWRWAWPHLRRKITAGLPEWYKEKLANGRLADEVDKDTGGGVECE